MEAQRNPSNLITGYGLIITSLPPTEDTKKQSAERYVGHPSREGEMEDMKYPGLDSRSSIFTLWSLGITACVREEMMKVKRCLQHSIWSPLTVKRVWWSSEVQEEYGPLQPRQGGGRESIRPETLSYKLIKILPLLSLICVFWHINKEGRIPHGKLLWVQPNILSCALSQNNCPLLLWRLAKTQWLTC